MSFKRFDTEDIVLSSELITFPTWYTQKGGDTDMLNVAGNEDCIVSPEQGFSTKYYRDYYSSYNPDTGSEESTPVYDKDHSKPLFSIAYASRPVSGTFNPAEAYVSGNYVGPSPSEIVFGQYRSLVLGDEYSDFMFGSTRIGYVESDEQTVVADSFVALSVDRSRFREKLDASTCLIHISGTLPDSNFDIAPDTTANRRYLDAGRVFDLAKVVYDESGNFERYEYPEIGSSATSYGYFLPDVGLILFNTSNSGSLFGINLEENVGVTDETDRVGTFKECLKWIRLRSQETVTSNFVFVRARNGEFNYSTNPSNIVGAAGNIRHDVMINQPQSFITTVGLYNDSNELLAVAKLSRPLVKDFTKEALIRIKLDY